MVSSERVTTSKDEGPSPAACAVAAVCGGFASMGDCGFSASLVVDVGTGLIASADGDSASVGCGAGVIEGGTSDNLGASASDGAAGERTPASAAPAASATCCAAAIGRLACRGAAA